MAKELDVHGITDLLRNYIIVTRNLDDLRTSYRANVIFLIMVLILAFALPFYQYISPVVLCTTGFILFFGGFYSLFKLFRLHKEIRYNLISIKEVESIIIMDYSRNVGSLSPMDALRFLELADKIGSKRSIPETSAVYFFIIMFFAVIPLWIWIIITRLF